MRIKTVTTYICDYCGKEYSDTLKAMKCEGAHLGLNLEEYKEYKHLIDAELAAAARVARTNNAETRKAEEDAINATLSFIEEHGIAENIKKVKGLC